MVSKISKSMSSSSAFKNLTFVQPYSSGFLAQIVINWTFSQPGITTAIVGARNPEQVEENAGAVNFKLTEEEIQKITEAFTWE